MTAAEYIEAIQIAERQAKMYQQLRLFAMRDLWKSRQRELIAARARLLMRGRIQDCEVYLRP